MRGLNHQKGKRRQDDVTGIGPVVDSQVTGGNMALGTRIQRSHLKTTVFSRKKPEGLMVLQCE